MMIGHPWVMLWIGIIIGFLFASFLLSRFSEENENHKIRLELMVNQLQAEVLSYQYSLKINRLGRHVTAEDLQKANRSPA